MSLAASKQPSIQMTLFDYFMDSEQFTLNEAVEAVKQVKEVKTPSVRARVYEGIDMGLFERVSKGVYSVKREENGQENTCLLINGDGRNLSMLEDESIDCIITDHPYELKKSLKGGNRDFAQYDTFQYSQRDFDEKARVLKKNCFLVEFLPEENADNYEYIYAVKQMAEKAGLKYYSTVPWKKGQFVANTGRKAKNTEQVVMFSKGKARDLKLNAKAEKAFWKSHDVLELHDYMPSGKATSASTDNYSQPSETSYFEEKSIALDICVPKEQKEEIESNAKDIIIDAFTGGYDYLHLFPELMNDGVECLDDLNMSIDDYVFEGLKRLGFEDIINLNKEDIHIYMSGTNGMLPTAFDVEPVSKTEKIHQAEKPAELLEQIIGFITMPNEKILDQFAGSGVVGEAALNTGRDSILIEKDKDTYNQAVNRVRRAKKR